MTPSPLTRRPNARLPLSLLVALVGVPALTLAGLGLLVYTVLQMACLGARSVTL